MQDTQRVSITESDLQDGAEVGVIKPAAVCYTAFVRANKPAAVILRVDDLTATGAPSNRDRADHVHG
ncbi:MAG: hypothetical protein J07HN4v3_01523 [Halonotius sp. J07HN4]|nr:MAG: hypothetical protein J07HN4v3_01523 [Halonotius sp. J07HN4]